MSIGIARFAQTAKTAVAGTPARAGISGYSIGQLFGGSAGGGSGDGFTDGDVNPLPDFSGPIMILIGLGIGLLTMGAMSD